MTADDRVATDRARFADWARFAREHGESPATPAATVVVLRDGPDGPETLMLRKNSKYAFGGMWVFPGGKVDPEDWQDAADDVDAARAAAVREAEEEARLRVEPDEMVLFAHWIPPSIAPKRYATWFFAAPVDDDDVIIDAGEIVDMTWLTPTEVLRRHHDGDVELVPPTWVTLDTLTGHADVAAVLAHLADRAPRHYATRVARSADTPVVMWEGDAGYETGDVDTPGGRHRLVMAPDGYVYDDSGVDRVTTAPAGLSRADVDERIAAGRVNDVPDAPVRSLGQIVKANVFTPVNAIIGSLFVLILVAGYPADALFAGVVISNSVIGIGQELQARRTLNALAVLSAPKARVRRDGETAEVGVSEVVADDVLELGPGDQVVVDGEVLVGAGLEIDESLLTGESDAVEKDAGTEVMSGSFVSAGSGFYRATKIGGESYAAQLSEEARRFELAHSELRRGVNIILRWLTFIIPPASVLLLLRQLDTEDRWQDALQATVAAAVAMVPDGLVLLTSLSFITGVIALARRKALAKELASVELLARVDTLCLDKTGTITTGEISLAGVEPVGGTTDAVAAEVLGALGASDPSPNATLQAIIAHHDAPEGWGVTRNLPFSSARKWAATEFGDRGTYYLGAPDILFDDDDDDEMVRAQELAESGLRVLLVTRADHGWQDDGLCPARTPVALVLLEDTVRADAPEILAFFRDQGVTLKVISGDNPATVAAVARRAGIDGAEVGHDARTLPEDQEELADILDRTTVFGRVTPHQKRAMVHALQSRGRTVAMTGDGVNDVLALKDADMGIAMGAGSSSTRAVAQLVLLDNKFSTLPRVLAEGRRVINNIERVANLFITKAAYAVLLTALVGIAGSPFPFLPRQLTLIGTFSIGLPGFFLALAPNEALVRPGFLTRVLRFSLPAGAVAGAVTFVLYEVIRRFDDVTLAEARTGATVTLLLMGLTILVLISRPLKPWKIALALGMAGLYTLNMVIPFFRDYFELDLPPGDAWVAIAIAAVVGSLGVVATTRLSGPDGPRRG